MTTLREAAQMALDALKDWDSLIKHQYNGSREAMSDLTVCAQSTPPIIEALCAALAQPEEEEDYDAIANKQLASLKAAAKVTFEDAVVRAVHKLYTAPPQREWQGLTKEECFELCVKHKDAPFSLLLAVQDKLKEKNDY